MAIAQPVTFATSSQLDGASQGSHGVVMCPATVQDADEQGRGRCLVTIDEQSVDATIGVMLPELAVGDVVLVARCIENQWAAITAVIAPSTLRPWNERSVKIQSNQSISLQSGAATLRLTAEGLARIVALTIEYDARDLVDIDAAEVRIN